MYHAFVHRCTDLTLCSKTMKAFEASPLQVRLSCARKVRPATIEDILHQPLQKLTRLGRSLVVLHLEVLEHNVCVICSLQSSRNTRKQSSNKSFITLNWCSGPAPSRIAASHSCNNSFLIVDKTLCVQEQTKPNCNNLLDLPHRGSALAHHTRRQLTDCIVAELSHVLRDVAVQGAAVRVTLSGCGGCNLIEMNSVNHSMCDAVHSMIHIIVSCHTHWLCFLCSSCFGRSNNFPCSKQTRIADGGIVPFKGGLLRVRARFTQGNPRYRPVAGADSTAAAKRDAAQGSNASRKRCDQGVASLRLAHHGREGNLWRKTGTNMATRPRVYMRCATLYGP